MTGIAKLNLIYYRLAGLACEAGYTKVQMRYPVTFKINTEPETSQ